MPTVSVFSGIIIRMYSPDHNPPHFHAYYQNYRAVVDFEGNIIHGNLPPKQSKLVAAWAVLREEDLKANWALMENHMQVVAIEPLK